MVRQLHGVFGWRTYACTRCKSFRNIHSDIVSIGERSLCWNREHAGWGEWRPEGSASDASSDAAAGWYGDESGEWSGFERFQQRFADMQYQGTGISLLQFGRDAIEACE